MTYPTDIDIDAYDRDPVAEINRMWLAFADIDVELTAGMLAELEMDYTDATTWFHHAIGVPA